MTASLPGRTPDRGQIKRALPYLALIAGLVLATAPAWRSMLFGSGLTFDDLLQLRCVTW